MASRVSNSYVRQAISAVFAILVFASTLALMLYHRVYLLTQPNEWAAWAALLVLAWLYALVVQAVYAVLEARFRLATATLLATLLAIALPYMARSAIEFVGYLINRWLIVGEQAMSAVVALGVLQASVLALLGLLLLAWLAAKRNWPRSHVAALPLVAFFALGWILQPRVF